MRAKLLLKAGLLNAGAGEATQRAIAAGATEEEIGDAALLGIGPGALEMFAPLAIVKRFGTLKKALGSGTATDVVSRSAFVQAVRFRSIVLCEIDF